ncbi:MAG: DNA alkylation repair protein, partial [Actinomycetota bacterium]
MGHPVRQVKRSGVNKSIKSTCHQVVAELESHADPAAAAGMARYGISGEKTLGVSIPVLRKMAKGIGKDHSLAAALWDSGIHEARILAGMVDDPAQVTEEQAEAWVADLDSWDVCD